MAKPSRISSNKVGLFPGSVVFTGSRRVERVQISLVEYGPGGVEEATFETPDDIRRPEPGRPGVQWVNVSGLHDTNVIDSIGARFDLHPLVLEDVASVGARAHLTEYDGTVFISLSTLTWSEEEMATAEHVSLLLGPNWVLSFQERDGDVFEAVRERIRDGSGRVGRHGADYLWYALLDAIVDNYFPVLEQLEQLAEGAEERVWKSEATARETALILRLRGEAVEIRRALRPLREEVDALVQAPPDAITADTRPFLSDLRDHVLQLSDTLDQVRDTLGATMDAHVAVVSMRTNEVMKVLTIMASIFIPLTFIVGVYGMNFIHMPELAVWWAYPAVWAVMLAVAGVMIAHFARRGWF